MLPILPFVHIPTWRAEDTAPYVLLAMASSGAIYCKNHLHGDRLHQAARVTTLKQVSQNRKPYPDFASHSPLRPEYFCHRVAVVFVATRYSRLYFLSYHMVHGAARATWCKTHCSFNQCLLRYVKALYVDRMVDKLPSRYFGVVNDNGVPQAWMTLAGRQCRGRIGSKRRLQSGESWPVQAYSCF